MKLYVDGRQVATRSGTKKAQVYRRFCVVGGDNLTSWPSGRLCEVINANLDEIVIYPVAPSALLVPLCTTP